MHKIIISKLDRLIDRVLAIGLKKLLIWDIVIYFLQMIYCGINITEYEVNVFHLAFMAVFFYMPILQTKMNILTGANETLIGRWWVLKYGCLLVIAIPVCFFGVLGFVMLLIRRDFDLTILNFIAFPLLYTCSKAVYLYNEREKEPPLWS